ncbi:hypothetical protein IZS58_004736 [Vibrio parahaemolyticus]|nr:hypothetical protein [Vibrio parahaemolyticus]
MPFSNKWKFNANKSLGYGFFVIETEITMPELIKGKCKWNVAGSVSNSQELETTKKICAVRGINQHWLQGKRVSFLFLKI